MLFAWGVSALALSFGAALGVRGLFDPSWAARLVRLREDGEGGFAEFRATYGGVFLGLHVVALVLVLKWMIDREPMVGAIASGACASVAAGWAGAAFGRAISIWRDKGAGTPFNRISTAVEIAMALCVGGPWAAWLFGAAS